MGSAAERVHSDSVPDDCSAEPQADDSELVPDDWPVELARADCLVERQVGDSSPDDLALPPDDSPACSAPDGYSAALAWAGLVPSDAHSLPADYLDDSSADSLEPWMQVDPVERCSRAGLQGGPWSEWRVCRRALP